MKLFEIIMLAIWTMFCVFLKTYALYLFFTEGFNTVNLLIFLIGAVQMYITRERIMAFEA